MNSDLDIKGSSMAEQIRAFRVGKGLTGAEFGDAIGLSRSKVSEIESGTRTPSVKVALAIEALSGGLIDAGSLNEDVKASRHGIGNTTKGAHDHVS